MQVGLLSRIEFVIVNSKLLKRHSKAVFQRIVLGRLRSGCQRVRGGRLGVKAGVV